ncbi:MAG: energy-coupling factor ABC transporter permease [Deltaproteobacteria bacterium]|nr:energy-coupling factor ABC transporter permease [Deltaproteobacteria bacterium]
MHIPDGFISPKVYIPAYAISLGLWAYSARKLKKFLSSETLPFLSAATAFSFVLMMVVVPLPGGTTAHALGIGTLTVLFGPNISFLCTSLVLLIQALLFGNGGITTLPVNALAIGFLGSYSLHFLLKPFKKYESVGIIISSLSAILISSFVLAIILGIQPLIATDESGKPLFFPFGIKVTIPAMLIPHIFVGIAEGILTLAAVKIIRRFDKERIFERKD